jgi:mannose-6-phosphate isomerase
MVWGGRRLETVLDKTLPSDEPYGEAWELSDHPLHRSIVDTGDLRGTSLQQLMEQDRRALLGPIFEQHAAFPWLFKFLDCNDWLSVQVHPDEQAIQRLGVNDGSKTEAWFILDAAPGSRIYAGLKPAVHEAKLRNAIRDGTVADCLHNFEPRAGDCVYLPAGTVHAVGGGVLMAEVQQTSDATFRLFDWGRPRQLHLEEALASTDWERGPVEPIHVPSFPDTRSKPKGSLEQPLVRSAYFHLDYHQCDSPLTIGGGERMQVVIVLRGRGSIATETGAEPISAGQVWLLPAAMSAGELRPEGTLKTLLCTLP